MQLNQIQGGRWDEVLRRLFSMKQGSIAPVVASEIVSNIILENDRPENLALANTRLWTIPAERLAGGAGQFSMLQAFNPVGSGILSVVTSIKYSSSTGAGTGTARIGVTALATAAGTEVKLDTRLINPNIGATFNSTTQGRTELAAALVAGTLVSQLSTPINTVVEMLKEPIILRPGFGVYTAAPANTTNRTTFQGYERTLNPSEIFETAL